MKVTPISVPDSASDPAHPDHERWVKDRTLKMEMDHAKTIGLSSRDAEAENARLLERTAHIAAEQKVAPKKKQQPNVGHNERLAKRGVTKLAGKPAPDIKRCSCGRCTGCLRSQRIMLIMQRGREDSALGELAKKLMVVSIQATTGKGPFFGLNKSDRERALHVYVDAACDASIRLLGAWR